MRYYEWVLQVWSRMRGSLHHIGRRRRRGWRTWVSVPKLEQILLISPVLYVNIGILGLWIYNFRLEPLLLQLLIWWHPHKEGWCWWKAWRSAIQAQWLCLHFSFHCSCYLRSSSPPSPRYLQRFQPQATKVWIFDINHLVHDQLMYLFAFILLVGEGASR